MRAVTTQIVDVGGLFWSADLQRRLLCQKAAQVEVSQG